MADRTFESASIARRMLEEEFDRNVPSRSSGFLTWMGIGGLFAVVFVVCGGFGAVLGGRQLLVQAEQTKDGLAPSAAGDVAPAMGAPAPVPPAAPASAVPPAEDDDARGVDEPESAEEPEPVEPPEPTEPIEEPEPVEEPEPARAPVRRRGSPRPAAPRPAPPRPEPEVEKPDDFDVETNDLIEVWDE